MIEVALASGFGSVRRFNETFQRMYRRPPSELRRRAAAGSPAAEITILLPYRPPYDWATMIRFLEARAIAGLEVVTAESYSRVIELDDVVGSIHVAHAPEQSSLQVTVRFPRLNVLPTIISRIRRQFDLGAEPTAIASALACDPILAPLVVARPGLRVPGAGTDSRSPFARCLANRSRLTRRRDSPPALCRRSAHSSPSRAACPASRTCFRRPERFHSQSVDRPGNAEGPRDVSGWHCGRGDCRRHLFDPRRDLAEAVARLRDVGRHRRVDGSVHRHACAGRKRCISGGRYRFATQLRQAWTRRLRRSCWLAPSGGDRGGRMPRCTCGWPTQRPPQAFSTKETYDALTA